ncbi:MAG: hypothetical protein ACR2OV_15065, partial [Hyphomicrobiaceae bacterium]
DRQSLLLDGHTSTVHPYDSRSRMHLAPAEREEELSGGNAGFTSRNSMQLNHVWCLTSQEPT